MLDNFATVEEAVDGLGKLNTMYNPFCKGLEITDGEGKVLGVHMVRRVSRLSLSILYSIHAPSILKHISLTLFYNI